MARPDREVVHAAFVSDRDRPPRSRSASSSSSRRPASRGFTRRSTSRRTHTIAFTDPKAPALGPIPRQPPNWSRLVVSRFDAQHYIGTALRGLSACPTDPAKADGYIYLQCGLGWLPAYGAAGGVVSDVTGLEPDYALTLLSVLCAISSSTACGSAGR